MIMLSVFNLGILLVPTILYTRVLVMSPADFVIKSVIVSLLFSPSNVFLDSKAAAPNSNMYLTQYVSDSAILGS